MKKSTLAVLLVIVLVIVGIVVFGRSGSSTPADQMSANPSGSPAPFVPVTETTKVSSKTSKYINSELGFSVDYPNAWEKDETDSGVTFLMPIDKTQVSTIAKLQADIGIASGKCAFPPVTTVKDRGILTVGNLTMSYITLANTVQGRAYFDRMYTLQQGTVCYIFHFASIALSPDSKGLTGSNLTQAQNNNKAIISTSDSDFTNMVKSFTFVQGPAGIDETKASPAK
jgi:hypothetical protein